MTIPYGLWAIIAPTTTPAAVQCDVRPTAVPLRSVSVSATLVGHVAEVSLTQTYFVSGHVPLSEATYTFPLDANSAVSSVVVRGEGGFRVEAEVREREEARREYRKAVHEGRRAVLMEERVKDVFQMKVGNVPPSEKVEVDVVYVVELQPFGKWIRWVLPTAIAPRYVPAGAEPFPVIQQSPEGGVQVSVLVKGSSEDILGVRSLSHEEQIVKQVEGELGTKVLLRLDKAEIDGDFVLDVEKKSPHDPKICIEKDKNRGTSAVLLSFYPKFQLAAPKSPDEFIFVIDRSGSMSGRKIFQAVQALQLFLRSLPPESYFDIVSFGSSSSSLFGTSKKYDESSLQEASSHVARITANFGGTELYDPLEGIFSRPRAIKGIHRKIFVLTDGQVSNTEQVISLTAQRIADKDSLFTFGVGAGVSHHLVEGMARAGRGTSVFLAGDGEGEISEAVVVHLKRALQPRLDDISIKWGTTRTKEVDPQPSKAQVTESSGASRSLLGFLSSKAPKHSTIFAESDATVLKQAPSRIPPIFNEDQFLLYRLFDKDDPIPSNVTIKAKTPSDGVLEVTLPINSEDAFEGDIMHRLAARKLIAELEDRKTIDGTRSEKRILDIGLTYRLISSKTSFVAVDRSSEAQASRLVGVCKVGRDNLGDMMDAAGSLLRGALNPYTMMGHTLGDSSGKRTLASHRVNLGPTKSFDSVSAQPTYPSPVNFPLGGGASHRDSLGASSLFSPSRGSLFGSQALFSPSGSAVFGSGSAVFGSRSSVFGSGSSVFGSQAEKLMYGQTEEGDDSEGDESHAFKTWTTAGASGLPSELNKNKKRLQGEQSSSLTLNKIVLLQKFNGAFEWNDGLLLALRSCGRFNGELCEVLNNISPEGFATALVISFLEKVLPELKLRWELILKKARTFLYGLGNAEATMKLAQSYLDQALKTPKAP